MLIAGHKNIAKLNEFSIIVMTIGHDYSFNIYDLPHTVSYLLLYIRCIRQSPSSPPIAEHMSV